MRPKYNKLLKNKQITEKYCGLTVGQSCDWHGTKIPFFPFRGL